MPLWIDRLPLNVDRDPVTGRERLGIALPVFVTNPNLSKPHGFPKIQSWLVDTRFTGEAFAWRHHLEEAGLDIRKYRRQYSYLTPLLSESRAYPVRQADLWLVSNLAGNATTPWRLKLRHGIAFHDVQRLPDPESNAPLLGMRALDAAGLTFQIDFRRRTVSVWTPGGIWESVAGAARRLAAGWRRTDPW